MHTRKPIAIPVVPAPGQAGEQTGSQCDDKEIIALMVLGVSMEPEFNEGEILVIEMGGQPYEGAYVIATEDDEPTFRQLKRDAQGGWLLHALNPVFPDAPIASLEAVRGVITQKKKAGSRKSVKFYGPQMAS
jgi:phage repressor protein C with HTH and peptisase S24 domain